MRLGWLGGGKRTYGDGGKVTVKRPRRRRVLFMYLLELALQIYTSRSKRSVHRRPKQTKKKKGRTHTSRRVVIVVWPVPVRDDVVPKGDAGGELRFEDVDLVEEEDEARLGEERVGDDGLPEQDGVLL